jgi:hypothetical protein
VAAHCWDHIGSAQDEAQLAMLLEMARARLHAGQQMLPLEENATTTGRGRRTREPVVEQTASLIVWEALEAVYAWLGFNQIGDNTFKAMVLARIIEPRHRRCHRIPRRSCPELEVIDEACRARYQECYALGCPEEQGQATPAGG